MIIIQWFKSSNIYVTSSKPLKFFSQRKKRENQNKVLILTSAIFQVPYRSGKYTEKNIGYLGPVWFLFFKTVFCFQKQIENTFDFHFFFFF